MRQTPVPEVAALPRSSRGHRRANDTRPSTPLQSRVQLLPPPIFDVVAQSLKFRGNFLHVFHIQFLPAWTSKFKLCFNSESLVVLLYQRDGVSEFGTRVHCRYAARALSKASCLPSRCSPCSLAFAVILYLNSDCSTNLMAACLILCIPVRDTYRLCRPKCAQNPRLMEASRVDGVMS